MTTNELKWYVVSQIGSSVSRSKILRNEKLHRKLKSIFGTNDIDSILKKLNTIGFTVITSNGNRVEPSEIKTYYKEPTTYEKSKEPYEFIKYATYRKTNYKKIMASYFRERKLARQKGELPKRSIKN